MTWPQPSLTSNREPGSARCSRVADSSGVAGSNLQAIALKGELCPLTERELDALRESHRGGSVAEIARAAHLAPGTVRNYLSSAIPKLGVRTRHDAARIAWDEGWI